MKTTQNYNLKKPNEDDFYNVNDFNDNMDVIDIKLKEVKDDPATDTKIGNRTISDPATDAGTTTGFLSSLFNRVVDTIRSLRATLNKIPIKNKVEIKDWNFDPATLNLNVGESVNLYGFGNAVNAPWPNSHCGTITKTNAIDAHNALVTRGGTCEIALRVYTSGAWKDWKYVYVSGNAVDTEKITVKNENDGIIDFVNNLGNLRGKMRVNNNGAVIISGTGGGIYLRGDDGNVNTQAILNADGSFAAQKFIGSLTGNADTANTAPWSGITGKPTTLAGYGITDASNISHTHDAIYRKYDIILNAATNQTSPWGLKLFSFAINCSTNNPGTSACIEIDQNEAFWNGQQKGYMKTVIQVSSNQTSNTPTTFSITGVTLGMNLGGRHTICYTVDNTNPSYPVITFYVIRSFGNVARFDGSIRIRQYAGISNILKYGFEQTTALTDYVSIPLFNLQVGTSNHFVKGDGSLDNNTYSLSNHTHDIPLATTDKVGGIKIGGTGVGDSANSDSLLQIKSDSKNVGYVELTENKILNALNSNKMINFSLGCSSGPNHASGGGYYYKIGKLVYISTVITINSIPSNSTAQISLVDLPYRSVAVLNHQKFTVISKLPNVFAKVNSYGTTLNFYKYGSGGAEEPLTWNDVSAGMEMSINGAYAVDD